MIGISLEIKNENELTSARDAMSDIGYFAALADLQLKNDITLYEEIVMANKDNAQTKHLAGLCRAAQSAVNDIQHTSKKARKIQQLQKPALDQDMIFGPNNAQPVGISSALLALARKTENA